MSLDRESHILKSMAFLDDTDDRSGVECRLKALSSEKRCLTEIQEEITTKSVLAGGSTPTRLLPQ